jgi:hypothetical protein
MYDKEWWVSIEDRREEEEAMAEFIADVAEQTQEVIDEEALEEVIADEVREE